MSTLIRLIHVRQVCVRLGGPPTYLHDSLQYCASGTQLVWIHTAALLANYEVDITSLDDWAIAELAMTVALMKFGFRVIGTWAREYYFRVATVCYWLTSGRS